jgi:hypothetical protein
MAPSSAGNRRSPTLDAIAGHRIPATPVMGRPLSFPPRPGPGGTAVSEEDALGPRFYQPRARHCATEARSAPSVPSLPWPG